MSQVNTELGRSSSALISLGESGVRALFGLPNGTISLNDGHGKSHSMGSTIAYGFPTGISVESGSYMYGQGEATVTLTINGDGTLSFYGTGDGYNGANIQGMYYCSPAPAASFALPIYIRWLNTGTTFMTSSMLPNNWYQISGSYQTLTLSAYENEMESESCYLNFTVDFANIYTVPVSMMAYVTM